ncbi:glycosyl hydrolase 115 family protein [Bacteroides stercorirosoris]|jgi:hypothetical protein|uniref:glycosyl hydrolase 115 family protein n=1 Tax=Bacteroides stercorirosoris TaxID=871324 RepID=UPI003522DCE8
MKIGFITILLSIAVQTAWGQFCLHSGTAATVNYSQLEAPVVHTALTLLQRDYRTVFSDSLPCKETQGNILVGTVGINKAIEQSGAELSALKGRKEAFLLQVLPNGRLLIAGSDSHGTAYGIMELSRLIGVSPWEWWADATPEKRDSFELPAGYKNVQSPSVEYRGIFVNDEDWGLTPWSSWTYEPWLYYGPGRIGPKTNERIFELLLRLRANTYWPAMHECTKPFFLTKGNREVAKKFGIYIGGSHCEPMASSTAGEWSQRGKGEYDYVRNSASVYKFWEQRVKEVAGQEILYTVGMRGVHDGAMNGAKTLDEQKAVLEHAFADQRRLLQQYVNEDVTKVPQVFIPYKEVLDVYHAGLEVPDDVTLMWCDDNYGYIKHFPTAKERTRRGGNGIYYHVSYWGRPHDYLWLGTFSPYLLYQQMKQAYDHDVRKIWILNVGDIKPAEYQTELFLDMAWNLDKVVEKGVSAHLGNFLQREFGEKVGGELLPVMEEHYRLAYIRKPEFIGNTREEEYSTSDYRVVKDMPWSKEYVEQRLSDYQYISDKAEQLSKQVKTEREDAYFQLVKYPVQAAAEMNKKLLYAQLARHGEADWWQSDAAYDSIVSLTRMYNTGIRNNGKWHRMMDHQPRRLPVFEPVVHQNVSAPMITERTPLHKWNGTECVRGDYQLCKGIGYEGKAIAITKEKSITFEFPGCPSDSIEVEICLLPSHPVEGTQLRFTVTLDGKETSPVHYETQGRSEEWKENVLRNQAVRRVILPVRKKKTNRLVIKALDEGVVLDQVSVYPF